METSIKTQNNNNTLHSIIYTPMLWYTINPLQIHFISPRLLYIICDDPPCLFLLLLVQLLNLLVWFISMHSTLNISLPFCSLHVSMYKYMYVTVKATPSKYYYVTCGGMLYVCSSFQIFSIVRDEKNPQLFSIEYVKGAIRTYTSTERDSLIASVLDGVRASGNRDVCVKMSFTDRGKRLGQQSGVEVGGSGRYHFNYLLGAKVNRINVTENVKPIVEFSHILQCYGPKFAKIYRVTSMTFITK